MTRVGSRRSSTLTTSGACAIGRTAASVRSSDSARPNATAGPRTSSGSTARRSARTSARLCEPSATGSTDPPAERESAGELQDVESLVPVDDVDEAASIDVDVIRLRRGLARRGLGDEVAGLARGERVGDVDDPQAAREPRAVDERVRHVLLELVRAEASRRGAAPRRVELAHL